MDPCLIDQADVAIRRGNNHPPVKWQFLISENPDVIFPLDGSSFRLTVYWPGGTILKSSVVDPELAIDLATSIVTWNYTVEESRSLPLGRCARYELERWIGETQQSHIDGYIAVSMGYNPDSDALTNAAAIPLTDEVDQPLISTI